MPTVFFSKKKELTDHQLLKKVISSHQLPRKGANAAKSIGVGGKQEALERNRIDNPGLDPRGGTVDHQETADGCRNQAIGGSPGTPPLNSWGIERGGQPTMVRAEQRRFLFLSPGRPRRRETKKGHEIVLENAFAEQQNTNRSFCQSSQVSRTRSSTDGEQKQFYVISRGFFAINRAAASRCRRCDCELLFITPRKTEIATTSS